MLNPMRFHTIYNNMIPKCGRAIAFKKFARCVVTIVRRARFTILLTILFTDTLFPVLFFCHNIHRGMWVAGSPLF